jgi:hypothetical protein
MTPMNYQQALASKADAFYARKGSQPWVIASREEVEEYKEEVESFNGDIPDGAIFAEFLPIPTAEQLLGAVEKSVVELFTFHSDCVDAVDLDELSFNPGDQVIIMRTPLEHGKVTQEGEK